jgi:tetrahydromethanopterin S-methyltransferase subunit H
MWKFGVEQKTFEICGQKIGSVPGERPLVLVGSIFYSRTKIVSDEFAGQFDRKAAGGTDKASGCLFR